MVNHPGTRIDYSSLRFIPSGKTISLMFSEKRVEKLYRPKQFPCVSENVHHKCRSRCFSETLSAAISCRLPFMKENLILQNCKNYSSSEKSKKSYLKLLTNFQPEKHCNCKPLCNITIYNVMLITLLQMSEEIDVFTMLYPYNIIERIYDEQAFSFISLLSAIGNILGPTLGICLFSIINPLIKSCAIIHYKLKNKVKI